MFTIAPHKYCKPTRLFSSICYIKIKKIKFRKELTYLKCIMVQGKWYKTTSALNKY